eukprot:2254668-Rhodomonas_salina.1
MTAGPHTTQQIHTQHCRPTQDNRSTRSEREGGKGGSDLAHRAGAQSGEEVVEEAEEMRERDLLPAPSVANTFSSVIKRFSTVQGKPAQSRHGHGSGRVGTHRVCQQAHA